jgi:putative glutamine amidotransferase
LYRILIPGTAHRFRNYEDALALAGLEAVSGAAGAACDGLLLPGGGDLDPAVYGRENTASREIDPVRDASELAAAAACFAGGKPVLGICRGAQLLCAALGGALLQDISGHGLQPDGLDSLHLTRASGLIAALCGPAPVVNSHHHQAAEAAPPGCRVLQRAEDGTIEAFAHDRLPVLAVQWHPERLCGRFRREGAADGLKIFLWLREACEKNG